SQIIKDQLFNGYYKLMPDKFTNVTNGIAYRRWLCQSNPRLTYLLEEAIGPDFRQDAGELENLLEFVNDENFLQELAYIKYQNKREFAKYLYKNNGIVIDPKTRFDVQVKRFHEYKRQLLNVLKIIALYIELEENPDLEMTPQTFIFGGKAAPSYFQVKEVIELINSLASEIGKHPEIRKKLNVVFVEDYKVSVAEILIPATEVSEQISLAGKEASGTGNMKFMINGALTLGTLDGANVEIHEQVGSKNIFIFGMNAEEVNKERVHYNPLDYLKNPIINKVIERLNKGFNSKNFNNISNYLLSTNHPDPYMCLADFESYLKKHKEMDKIYQDKKLWNQMSLINIAKAGIFSADRSVKEYAKNIWGLKALK
ncbi:MAG: glycogen/starch/alpha-glucan phosphorylase, partial [Bacilli bacterium]|nr:glycogen/starch/alpha-glucan phosphorylase [Bacilli bacterium]